VDAIGYSAWQTLRMRKFLLLLVLSLAAAGGLAYVVRNLDAYLQARRDWIAARAGEELGREVSFVDIGVTLRGGLGAKLRGLRIGEDPTLGDEPFTAVEEVRLRLDLWSALRGEYVVTSVVLVRPRGVIVRTSRGLNVDSIGRKRKGAAAKAKGVSETASEALPLHISVVEVRDGAFRYVDRTASPAREYALVGVDVTLSEIGLHREIGVHAHARVVDDRRDDVRVEGSVGPLVAADLAALPLALRASFGPVSIDALKRSASFTSLVPEQFDSAEPLRLDATIGGTLQQPKIDVVLDATAAQLRFGRQVVKPPGVPLEVTADLDANREMIKVHALDVRLADTKVRLTGRVHTAPEIRWDLRLGGDAVPLDGWQQMVPALADHVLQGRASPDLRIKGTGRPRVVGEVGFDDVVLEKDGLRVDELNAIVAIDGDQMSLPKTRFRLNGAALELGGRYDRARDSFEVRSAAHGLLLGPLLNRYAPQAADVLDGIVDAELQLDGRGSTWEAIRTALKGSGRFRVRDGVLRDVNVAEEVLAGLTGMKGLTGMLASDVRAKYPTLLQAHDTAFEDMSGRVQIASGSAHTEDFRLQAGEGLVAGVATLSLAGNLDFDGTISFAPQLSEDLVQRVRALRGLIASDGRLAIPFRIAGKLPAAQAMPDVDFVLRRVGRDVLESGIDKLFRRSTEDAGPGGGEGESTPTARPEERMLRRGLDRLLGH